MLQYFLFDYAGGFDMDNAKTCAECLNLGREIYCMQCKRLKNGPNDMFIEEVSATSKKPDITKN